MAPSESEKRAPLERDGSRPKCFGSEICEGALIAANIDIFEYLKGSKKLKVFKWFFEFSTFSNFYNAEALRNPASAKRDMAWITDIVASAD